MIKYSPAKENNAVERIDFYRGDQKITLVNRFDTYAVYVDEEDDDFDMSNYNEDLGQIMIFTDEEAGEIVESRVEGDLSDLERIDIVDAFADRLEGGVADLGWTWSDRELWFYGPIDRDLLVDESEGGHLD
jgi:hypothetical protein